ncbi:ParB/RepB/Spo0J family partition protein [Acidocella sp.]|uniref:ParB/RepB/Spo0J family partition protein n=1 Tax=Acidocella sp. TaxID=50710 RepID=UPI003D07C142
MTQTKEPGAARSAAKIMLSASRDIPFNKLRLSQANVRKVKAGISIEELAADIARRGLLQSLVVRQVQEGSGAETGMYEIPAGGRRYRALELLVRQKRLSKNAPIPCIVRTSGIDEEDSLAENVQRAPLHPLDQFRAFQTLREQKGQSEEEIAAVFFVSTSVVKQRLRLASVSPRLLEVYAEDGMTLDQLMGFTVNPDHERQEQVWDAIQHGWKKDAPHIRSLLTEGAVRASDKRAAYVAAEYEAAGGPVMRDLFQADEGGWFQDVTLLERLVGEKLERDAAVVRAEGWKWVEVAPDFAYGHTYGLRGLRGTQPSLAEEAAANEAALRAEAENLEAEYEDAPEYPEEVERRLGEIDEALTAIEERPLVYEAADIAIAGAFVSIGRDGALHVERGYVRREDEPPVPEMAVAGDVGGEEEVSPEDGVDGIGDEAADGMAPRGAAPDAEEEPEEDGIRPLSDRLLTELTAYRTLALREAVANDPGIAFLAMLHALVLQLLYPYALDSCLEVRASMVGFGNRAPGLADTKLAQIIDARHRALTQKLPEDPRALWEALVGLDSDSRHELFAHCVSLTVNGIHEAFNRQPRAIAHAGQLAEVLSVNLVDAGWVATADNYLGRVTKARILEAVREAKGDDAVDRIAHLKKGDMAAAAEKLLAGTGWLPEVVRTPGVNTMVAPQADDESAGASEPTADNGDVVDVPVINQDDPNHQAIAAE